MSPDFLIPGLAGASFLFLWVIKAILFVIGAVFAVRGWRIVKKKDPIYHVAYIMALVWMVFF